MPGVAGAAPAAGRTDVVDLTNDQTDDISDTELEVNLLSVEPVAARALSMHHACQWLAYLSNLHSQLDLSWHD